MQTFSELGLCPEILKAIADLGYENPTPIQQKTIPHLLQYGGDLIALAQTGTGKTAAFSLPVIEQIDDELERTQVLALCPTRELGIQVAKEIENYTKYFKNINVCAVYGGESIDKQIKQLRKNPQIVVGTPGRTLDLIKRKRLKVDNIQWLILDEADEMLNMGFKDELDAILENTPDEKQTLLFSATMPKEIRQISRDYMTNPAELAAERSNLGAENVTHQYYLVKREHKYETLKRIADMNPTIYGIVFCRTRMDCKEVAERLIKDGYNADALHGDLSQAMRDKVMNRFRDKSLQLLIATDVAARGIDVNNLTHVINYTLPETTEAYIHRSGRTGRAGRKGLSVSILERRDMNRVSHFEKKVGKTFEKELVPGGREICEKRLFNLIDKIKQVELDEKQLASFIESIYEKFDGMTREELIQRFVSVEFNQFLAYYENARDINASADRGSERRNSRDDKDFTRIFINLGKKDSLNPRGLINLLNAEPAIRKADIGAIDIQRSFSFFEIETKYKVDLFEALIGKDFSGREIDMEVSTKPMRSRAERRGERGGRGGGGRDRRGGARGGDRRRGGGGEGRSRGRKERSSYRSDEGGKGREAKKKRYGRDKKRR